MQHEALLYSLDPKITRKQLQESNPPYDATKYAKLQERVSEYNIQAMVVWEPDMHYKILPIRPKVKNLYYVGDLWVLNKKILGIVGPRQMSGYGKKVLETLFDSARAYDVVTISGLAEGVDQLCHQLSCHHHIPTVAVLGWGMGYYSKRPERKLIQQIVANGGLVLSEYKLGEKPTHYTFPQRNRLIAWLADLLFLPEAGAKSGSLITVDCAIAMKKPIYATPNTIFAPTSAGILQLMERGWVKPIYDLSKFLSTHFTTKQICTRPKTTDILTDQEQLLVSFIFNNHGNDIQSLLYATWSTLQEIVPLLTLLEIKWLLVQDEPGKYRLV